MFITIIEWDGKQPPTQYYLRLAKLGLRVRGNKDITPVMRRMSEGEQPAVIAQEGAIMTATESLARVVGDYALRYGAKNVHIGEVDFLSTEADNADTAMINYIESIFGARGRKHKHDKHTDWTITCLECLQSTQVQNETRPVQCPHCGGVKTQVRVGQIPTWGRRYDKSTSLIDYWLNTRYSHETLVFPDTDYSSNEIPDAAGDIPDEALEIAKKISTDTLMFLDFLNDDARAVKILDGILVGALYETPEKMRSNRVSMVMSVWANGFDQNLFPLTTGKEYDLLDSTYLIYLGTALSVSSIIRRYDAYKKLYSKK